MKNAKIRKVLARFLLGLVQPANRNAEPGYTTENLWKIIFDIDLPTKILLILRLQLKHVKNHFYVLQPK